MPTEVTDPSLLEALEGEDGSKPSPPDADLQSGRDAGLYGSFVEGFSSDEGEMVRFLASRLYPDEPTDQAVKRFGKREGTIFHRGDDGNLYEALPSGTLSGMAKSVGPSIPIGAGTAMGVLTSPLSATGVGFPASLAATSAAAAGGEAVRQGIGNVLMGDDANPGLEPMPIAEQAALGAAGQATGVGIGAMATKGAVRDIGRFDPAKTQQAYDEAARVGIPITPAEATGLPTLAAQQKRLSNITPTAAKMREFVATRDKTIVQRWGEYLDTISAHSDAERVGKLARDSARSVLSDMRATLKAQAKPFYDAAYAKPVPYTTELEALLKRPVMQKALGKARELSANEAIQSKQFFAQQNPRTGQWAFTRVPDMREWDYIKRGLDEILGSAEALNQSTGGPNNYGRIVSGIKADLLEQLDTAVPEYKMARDIYSDGVEDVTNAMQSALSVLAKTKDTKILSAARHVFDPRSRSPEMVRYLRGELGGKSPQAWQAIKRLYMQDVTIDALRMAETGEVPNVAGKLHKAFTNPKLQDNLFAAMSPAERKRYMDLMVVFKRAASVPALRSDTEFNRLMTREAEKAARPLSAKIARGLEFWKYPERLAEWRTDKNLDRHAEKVVDLIVSGDPEALNTMKELRRLSISDRQWLGLFGHLLTRMGAYSASELLPETSYEPSPNQLRDVPMLPPSRNQPAGPRVSGAVP
jgi:hypothetical protein